MNTRKALAAVTYNGKQITTAMDQYGMSISYKDVASGESDELELQVQDRDGRWKTAWMPVKGDTIQASIQVQDWNATGDNRTLQCGLFVLDDFTFEGGPATGSIKAVSVPADSSFRETERTKIWEAVTIKEIASEIAKRAGVSLLFDVPGPAFTIKSIEQSGQTDCEFLCGLCQIYGYSMKVYARKIVIFDREVYKQKPPVGTIDLSDISSWSWNSTLAGTYTGGELTYTDPRTEQEITARVGSGNRILKLSESADSPADAERKIMAAVNRENHSATTITVSRRGDPGIVAGQTWTVTGVGKLSGKYYIDSVSHSIGGGYQMELEMSLVASMTDAVVLDAIQRIYAVGIIDTPAYWDNHYKDVQYLDGLLLNIATIIKVNKSGTAITGAPQAVNALVSGGVLNSPNYWLQHYGDIKWLDRLIINAANAMG